MLIYIEDIDGDKRRYRRPDGTIAGYVGFITGDENWEETGGINMLDLEHSIITNQATLNPKQSLYNLLTITYGITNQQASEISGYYP